MTAEISPPADAGAQAGWHAERMCGRYASFRQAQAIADTFDVVEAFAVTQAVRRSVDAGPVDR